MQNAPPIHADASLAARLEAIELSMCVSFGRTLARLRPEVGAVVEPIAGGFAVFAGKGSPLTEAKGMGLSGPVSEDELDRLDAFYRGRGVTARVSICPLAYPSLVDGLGRRGYRLAEFENVLARPLDDVSTASGAPDPSLVVRRAEPDEADIFFDAVMPGFFPPEALTPEIRDLVTMSFQTADTYPMLALLDGVPVGGGTLLVHEGVALMAGAATLPAYRRRGVQRAVQLARLDLARQLGCDLVTQTAQPGSSSQRNAERQGLRVAYTKVILAREPT